MVTGFQFFLGGAALLLISYLWNRDLGERQSVKIQEKINDSERKIKECDNEIKGLDKIKGAADNARRLSGDTSSSRGSRDLKKSRDKAEKELNKNKARIAYLEDKRKTQKPIADLTAIIGLVTAVIGLVKEIWLK